MVKIEHLVSTMYQENLDFSFSMGCNTDVLIVNQTMIDGKNDIVAHNNHHYRIISTTERGLSNSRNMLLDRAVGDIGIIGDDDLLYTNGYIEKIQAAYAAHPDADIIVFSYTQSLEKDTRRQFSCEKKLNIFNISKVASVEITVKNKSIREANIKFCPLLGLGAKYGACEENAFLADALRAGLTIWYVPETICYLKPDPPERVKWQNGFDRDYFIKRGACFYRIYKYAFVPFSIAFLILKKRNVFSDISIIKAFRWMCEGRKEFILDEET